MSKKKVKVTKKKKPRSMLGPAFEEKNHPAWKLYWNEDGTRYDPYMDEEAAYRACKIERG